jgi:hypothetical protein
MIFEVRDGTAHFDDARAVLAEFVRQNSTGAGVSKDLLAYLGAAFESYLSEEHSIEQALGLVRPKAGRPTTAHTERAAEIAYEVLAECLKGRKLEAAVITVGQRMGLSRTPVERYWKANRTTAVVKARMGRPANGDPWTRVEKKILERVLRESNRWWLDCGGWPLAKRKPKKTP